MGVSYELCEKWTNKVASINIMVTEDLAAKCVKKTTLIQTPPWQNYIVDDGNPLLTAFQQKLCQTSFWKIICCYKKDVRSKICLKVDTSENKTEVFLYWSFSICWHSSNAKKKKPLGVSNSFHLVVMLGNIFWDRIRHANPICLLTWYILCEQKIYLADRKTCQWLARHSNNHCMQSGFHQEKWKCW